MRFSDHSTTKAKDEQKPTYLQGEGGLLVVDSHKDLPHYELLAVIAEHKVCTEAFIIFSL